MASILVGKTRAGKQVELDLRMANRHGLIAGATGTGKTVTLRVLTEGFARAGVPVFTADVKGDLSGIALAGERTPVIEQRLKDLGLESFNPQHFPTLYWDVYGKQGHPIRATVSDVGPTLLSRLLGLSEVQEGVLQSLFKMADDQGLLLLDLKDLNALLDFAGTHAQQLQGQYGNFAKSSLGAIQRSLVALEAQGGATFFGEPALNLEHLMQRDFGGAGVVSVVAADRLINSPIVYSTTLLYILSELFEQLPEAGDLEKPKLVFFFDEAHLLFNEAPPVLIQKIEQVVRLIRSRGVGIYFVTQSPADIPDSVLAQLGNRFQHALRAYTPKDQKAVKVAAESFRENPEFKTADAISALGVGEALVSVLDEKGVPTIVEQVLIAPPSSRLKPVTDEERAAVIGRSPLKGVYDNPLDRESAYELLKKRGEEAATATADSGNSASGVVASSMPILKSFMQSAARAIGSQVGRQIVRGLLGSLGASPTRRRR